MVHSQKNLVLEDITACNEYSTGKYDFLDQADLR